MIAQRFRSLGWVAGVATAATGLYLISLQVAAERGKLDAVERQIALAQRDMRQLQTELGTRGSLRQLEKWNGDVLSLSAPRARQFLASATQLSSFNAGMLEGATGAAPVVMAASFITPPVDDKVPAAITLPAQHAAVQRVAVDRAAIQRVAVERATAPRAMFQHATYDKPVATPHIQRVAMLDSSVLGDLGRVASEERRTRP